MSRGLDLAHPLAFALAVAALVGWQGANAQPKAGETGVIEGAVLRAVDASPIPFANDPVFTDTVHVVAGDTLRRTTRVPSPGHERFLAIRDSLRARGRWPPSLDSTLHVRMRDAQAVRVFRLDPETQSSAPDDTIHYIRYWRIEGEVKRPSRAVIDSLLPTFMRSELYMLGIEGDMKKCGGFQPGIAVRYAGTGPTTDLLLCYKCDEFWIESRDGVRQTGDFEGEQPAFVRFAKALFPDDAAIQRLEIRGRR